MHAERFVLRMAGALPATVLAAALSGALPGMAGVVLDEPLQGSTAGQRSGGSFAAGGWRVDGKNDSILWHIPTVREGAAEWDVRGEPKKLFVESRKKIEGAPKAVPASTRRLLLAVMAVLSARVIEDRAFLKRCITEVDVMGDNWVIDWLEERGRDKGRVEGLAEGRVEGLAMGRIDEARRAVLRVIERRFGEAPPDLRARIEGLTTLERLEWLHDEAVSCASLTELREVLDRP